jgi:phosphoadenosine phosphosulfate reductase
VDVDYARSFPVFTVQDIFAYRYKYDLPIHPNYAILGNGQWDQKNIRVTEIGDIHGTERGLAEWEKNTTRTFAQLQI